MTEPDRQHEPAASPAPLPAAASDAPPALPGPPPASPLGQASGANEASLGGSQGSPLYELELEPDAAVPTARPASAATKHASPQKPTPGEPGLLAGFDPDTDFDKDPDVAAAVAAGTRSNALGARPSGQARPVAAPPRRMVDADPVAAAADTDIGGVLARDGLGDERTIAIAAGITTAVAGLVAAVTAPRGAVAAGLSTIYHTLLFATAGVAAMFIAASLLQMTVGRRLLGAARMFLATASFQLLSNLRFGLSHRSIEAVLACVGYFLIVWLFFSIRPRTALVIGAFHAAIVIAVELGYVIASWADAAAAIPGAGR